MTAKNETITRTCMPRSARSVAFMKGFWLAEASFLNAHAEIMCKHVWNPVRLSQACPYAIHHKHCEDFANRPSVKARRGKI